MSIFGPLSLLCWIYATLFWLVTGRQPGYGGYDSHGKLITQRVPGRNASVNTILTKDHMNGMDMMGMNGMNGMNGIKNGKRAKKNGI
jgi:hypothetical protein